MADEFRDDVSELGESLDASTLSPSNAEPGSASSSQHRYEPVPATETNTAQFENPAVHNDSQASMGTSKEHNDVTYEAGLLTRSRFHWTILVPLDVILAMSPTFFFAIASICFSLHGREKSAYGENIKAITLVTPSIFPILYAAILGKMLRRVGLYKAERSATIGSVERLVGCQSVFTAIERQIALRRFDFLGLSILLAWLLSPIGGQTSLRMLSSRTPIQEFKSNIWYYPIEGFWAQTLVDRDLVFWPYWGPVYLTALQTAQKYWDSPRDMSGNVRIPDIRQLSPATIQDPEFSWHNFSHLRQIEYTSMLGIPVVGLPETGNSSFKMQSFYWAIECGKWNQTDFAEDTDSQVPSFAMKSKYNGGPPDQLPFTYQSRRITGRESDGSDVNVTGILSTSSCCGTAILVESEIGCQGPFCNVLGMRRLPLRGGYLSSSMPPFDWLERALIQMPDADVVFGRSHAYKPSSQLVEQWIIDPYLRQFDMVRNESGAALPREKVWVDLTNLTPDKFSHRLQLAINTFWEASVGGGIRMGNLTLDQISPVNLEFALSWNKTELKGVEYGSEQYVCNKPFAAITMALSLALCVAAIVSLILGMITKAPDILGFVSTSARDNPYVQEHVPSRSDGLQAARALRDVRVRIGDVNGRGDVGHLAFTTVELGSGRLSRKRLYD